MCPRPFLNGYRCRKRLNPLSTFPGSYHIGASVLALNMSGDRSNTGVTAEAGPVKHVTLPVEGMTCGGCAISVKMALKELDGIRGTDVDVGKGEAVVTFNEGEVTVDQMIEVINSTGFTARRPDTG